MALAADEVAITIGGQRLNLRPSLRYAMRLERRPGSFAGLVREILDGSLTAAHEIISAHHAVSLSDLLSELTSLREPLLTYVMQCAGLDDDPADKHPSEGSRKPVQRKVAAKALSFGEHLASLYRLATGWLGWPPQVALDATPREIIEAQTGRMEMLKAIFGSADEIPAMPASPGDLTEKFRDVFAGKTVKVSRRKKRHAATA